MEKRRESWGVKYDPITSKYMKKHILLYIEYVLITIKKKIRSD